MIATELPGETTRYFVELGWSREDAQLWLTDTASLASIRLGGTSAAAAEHSPASAQGRMVEKVYRELEMLERQARAKILTEVLARLARQAATLGSAGLELVAPAAPQSRDALVSAMSWEAQRAKSERILAEVRSHSGRAAMPADVTPREPSSEPQDDSPRGIALGLGRLARRLTSDEVARIAMIEAALAFGEEDAARDLALEELASLPPSDEGETDEESLLRERCTRLLVLAYFLLGDNARALALTETIPLVLDRSASMGTLRAALEFRLRQGDPVLPTEGDGGGSGRRAYDEFVAPVGPAERRSVARFLSLAHRTPAKMSSDGATRPNPGVVR